MEADQLDLFTIEELINRTRPKLLGLANKVLKNSYNAEDAVQEAIVRLLSYLARNPNAQFSEGYLFVTIINVMRTEWRKKKRLLEQGITVESTERADGSTIDPENTLWSMPPVRSERSRQIDRKAIKTFLAKFSSEEKEIYLLNMSCDLSIQEIARLKGEPTEYIYQVLNKLKSCVSYRAERYSEMHEDWFDELKYVCNIETKN